MEEVGGAGVAERKNSIVETVAQEGRIVDKQSQKGEVDVEEMNKADFVGHPEEEDRIVVVVIVAVVVFVVVVYHLQFL